ncbi:MAG: L-threonylcarbamoyladenylate synthase [Anaerolineae bacterium]
MPPEVYTTRVLPADDPRAIETAVALLRQGEIVAFPTDTVYGVGCDPWQILAVERLYDVKQRPLTMAIPLLVADTAQVDKVAVELNDTFTNLSEHFWPGELTLIVKRQAAVPEIVTAGGSTLALRMPDNPVALQLCRHLGGALATTSANLSGEPACVTAEQVFRSLTGRIPLILDGGQAHGGVASTIIDCVSQPPRILRRGNLGLQQLRAVVPTLVTLEH